MLFETVRWGLPNTAAIIALAMLPLISSVVSDRRAPAPIPLATLDIQAISAADLHVTSVELE